VRIYPSPISIANLNDVTRELKKIADCSLDVFLPTIAKAYTLPTFTNNRTLVIPALDAAPATQAFPQTEQGLTNYPVLRVHQSANLTITGSFNKVPFDTTDFDTASWWDGTNHRYTPQQAGYYRVTASGGVQVGVGGLTSVTAFAVAIFKNGAEAARAHWAAPASASNALEVINCNDIVHCNGSTDFIEMDAALVGAGTLSLAGSATYSYLSIELVSPPLLGAQPALLTNPAAQAIDPTQVINAITVLATWLADCQKGNIFKNQ
jgi:hypothetical protein